MRIRCCRRTLRGNGKDGTGVKSCHVSTMLAMSQLIPLVCSIGQFEHLFFIAYIKKHLKQCKNFLAKQIISFPNFWHFHHPCLTRYSKTGIKTGRWKRSHSLFSKSLFTSLTSPGLPLWWVPDWTSVWYWAQLTAYTRYTRATDPDELGAHRNT